MVLSTPDSSTSVSCAASSANLLGAEVNGSWVRLATSLAKASAKPLGALRPVPTAVPPCASRMHPRQHAFDPGDAVLDLRRIAGEFLAQRQRRRVLQVGAADLDDRVPAPAPGRRAGAWIVLSAGSSSRSTAIARRRCASRSGSCRSTTGPC